MRSENIAENFALNAVRLPKFEPVNGISWSPRKIMVKDAYPRRNVYWPRPSLGLSVCLSLAAFPHCCADPDVTWGNGRVCSPSCALLGGLATVHGFRFCDNIAGTWNVSECSVLALCLVDTGIYNRCYETWATTRIPCDWHYELWPWMTLNSLSSRSLKLHIKYFENGDRYDMMASVEVK